ncbi:hypothetical protein HYFRA_00006194 [Hymenoscyphus fraxineus]|uniref:DUF7580 domain-containing protein n=1 Tax=Hymenoscyphus fraxineus TaxID=746836 RepID=A0A9N9Q1D2_9HELO|nr:hypothetical protein HYFRA_00006194 [Hymenoscyphus fraxineus]
MSGVEIVVVLKTCLTVFPVILKAANEFIPILSGGKEWWSFEQAYLEFVSVIHTESIAYEQNLQLLFGTLDYDLDLLESDYLYKNPDSKAWDDPAARAKIMRRIPADHFEWFRGQMQKMNDTLTKLHRLLPVRDEKVQYLERETIDYEISRLRISFSREKSLLLADLPKINDNLFKFLFKASLVSHTTGSKHTTSSKRLQSHAKTLYKTLQKIPQCSDSNHVHELSITAEWKPSDLEREPPHLKLLLGKSSDWKQVRWAVENVNPVVSESPKSRNIISDVSSLQETAQVRNWRESVVEKVESREPGSYVGRAAVSAASTMLNPTFESTEKLWSKRETKKLKKRSKLRSLDASNQAIVSKPPSTHFSPLSKRSSVVNPAAISGTESETDSNPKLVVPEAHTKQVHFSTENKSAPNPQLFQTTALKITDTCSFLDGIGNRKTNEYFDLGETFLSFRPDPVDQLELKDRELVQLQEIATSTPNLPDRLRLGVNIALAILSFGASGWIPQNWNRENVYVLRHPRAGVRSTQAYISYKPQPGKVAREDLEQDDLVAYSEAVLFTLGVIFLELMDNKLLKNTSHWEKNCPDGKEHEMSEFCAAIQWQQDVSLRQSPDLSDPIKRCLKSQFSAAANFDNPAFLQEVFDGVLGPLESFMAGWTKLRGSHLHAR